MIFRTKSMIFRSDIFCSKAKTNKTQERKGRIFFIFNILIPSNKNIPICFVFFNVRLHMVVVTGVFVDNAIKANQQDAFFPLAYFFYSNCQALGGLAVRIKVKCYGSAPVSICFFFFVLFPVCFVSVFLFSFRFGFVSFFFFVSVVSVSFCVGFHLVLFHG